ncbi:alpha-E domain-containing protein [Roseococcus pinisoli]|uniref:Alpha-E domain-containing protein n=1 Tax=Roseococcus pinisoli TaxID=2835040 RepID=A0ABS5QEH8_9PROT|nr:alpha-E domain-containing protein [Roseococcus pinisoli]MBS7811952.1 alpha-E domain-containing protein [Roseococcus pinisoli]
MLSRAAESLFWLGRYTERAANVARGLAVASRMASLTDELNAENDQWRSLLVAAGCEPAFFQHHREATEEKVVDFLIRDPGNFSGIIPCFAAARQNGRSVRTSLTVDMWSALSDSWTRLRHVTPADFQGEKLHGFLEWVRERVLLFNGAAMDTMLRGEAWLFVQLGTALERADATARLLDVKHDLLGGPSREVTVQHGQCQAVLQSVSGLRAYQWTYRDRIEPGRVAEFLILNREMPRSLAACYDRVCEVLELIAAGQGGRRGECHRMARATQAALHAGRIEDIMRGGLHDYLTETINGVATLGGEIEAFYIRA